MSTLQGIFINGKRPATKKAVREAIIAAPETVEIEATSMFGNEYGGPAPDMPEGKVAFVGPDPERNRKFFGTIIKHNGNLRVT